MHSPHFTIQTSVENIVTKNKQSPTTCPHSRLRYVYSHLSMATSEWTPESEQITMDASIHLSSIIIIVVKHVSDRSSAHTCDALSVCANRKLKIYKRIRSGKVTDWSPTSVCRLAGSEFGSFWFQPNILSLSRRTPQVSPRQYKLMRIRVDSSSNVHMASCW